ncbi:hypothetical protein CHARACLAT_033669 [Characodon lateralis]|uniref:Secreted protein n=1 Tax=Characodon lateralis TaxID=208331 RepID=A0ABU7EPV9_9TELE|nr:hypothetical protein [Characodon lateralis]
MSGSWFVFLCLLHLLILRWCWSSQVCWVTGATYSTDCQEEYLSRRLPALQCESVFATVVQTLATLQVMLHTSTSFNFVFCSSADFESLSFGSMSLSFLDYVSECYSGRSSLSSF